MNAPTFQQFKAFLIKHGCTPDREALTLDEYTDLVEECKFLYGNEVAQYLKDSFMPEGKAIEPGYEDSLSHYLFHFDKWDDVEKDWNEWVHEGVPENPSPGSVPSSKMRR